jgi:hypothetical protein
MASCVRRHGAPLATATYLVPDLGGKAIIKTGAT